jgi:sugar phosphate isomerase/epimerase
MKIGIFAKTFAGQDPATVLAACREAGYQSCQYNMSCSGLGPLPEVVGRDDAEAVVVAAAATGIEIAALSATYNMTDPVEERRASGRRSFAALAALARSMGARLLTVCSGSRDRDDQWRHHPDNATPGAWADMCREFEFLIQHAEQHHIEIGVEPEQANVVSSAARARDLLREFSGGPIRIVLDPANLIEHAGPSRQQTIIDEALDLLGDHIALVHAKDRDAGGRVAAAGQGIVDWRRLIGQLRASGYEGHLIAHGLPASEAPQTASYLKAALGQA